MHFGHACLPRDCRCRTDCLRKIQGQSRLCGGKVTCACARAWVGVCVCARVLDGALWKGLSAMRWGCTPPQNETLVNGNKNQDNQNICGPHRPVAHVWSYFPCSMCRSRMKFFQQFTTLSTGSYTSLMQSPSPTKHQLSKLHTTLPGFLAVAHKTGAKMACPGKWKNMDQHLRFAPVSFCATAIWGPAASGPFFLGAQPGLVSSAGLPEPVPSLRLQGKAGAAIFWRFSQVARNIFR